MYIVLKAVVKTIAIKMTIFKMTHMYGLFPSV